MATEGLPLVRQERSADYDDRGILAGEDFLSVFLRQAYQDTTTTTTTSEPSTLPMTWRTNNEVYDDSSYVRGTRSTVYLTSPFAQEEQQTNFPTTRNSAQELNSDYRKQSSSESSENDGAVVRVSSSIGRTLIHKDNRHSKDDSVVTTDAIDQSFVASEEHPSIVAEANKSEFNVEESEPITRNSDLAAAGFGRGFPAGVQALTRSQNLGFNTDFLQDKIQPIQHTVIYHNTAKEGSQARSVSYSTVIQAVPQMTDEKHWDGERLPQHERHERHYDGNAYVNNFHNEKPKTNSTKPQNSAAIQSHPMPEKNWEKSEQYYTTTRRNPITTERNWEAVYSPPSPRLPTVYGRPEQNYEVDESASVMTNGRAHGVQAAPTASTKDETKIGEGKKADDNQKVGYVVEGRNYRKYRVEERTADGFIVGEYGVVSHDDGSLRGVRYTADGTINPRLIYDALMKFLSL